MKSLKGDSTRLNVSNSRPVESCLSVWTRLVCCVQRSAPLLISRSICVSLETTFCRSALAFTVHSSRCSRVSVLHASLYAIITNNCNFASITNKVLSLGQPWVTDRAFPVAAPRAWNSLPSSFELQRYSSPSDEN